MPTFTHYIASSDKIITLKSTGGPELSDLKAKHIAVSRPGTMAQSFLDRPPGLHGAPPYPLG